MVPTADHSGYHQSLVIHFALTAKHLQEKVRHALAVFGDIVMCLVADGVFATYLSRTSGFSGDRQTYCAYNGYLQNFDERCSLQLQDSP